MEKKNFLSRAINAIWAFFKKMNSEPNGEVSIKRNMAWGIATLTVVVEVAGMWITYQLVKCKPEGATIFTYLIMFLVLANLLFIVLALKITSVEKLGLLANNVAKIRAGILGGGNTTPEPQPAKEQAQNEPQPLLTENPQ
jgi:hypothetical protein